MQEMSDVISHKCFFKGDECASQGVLRMLDKYLFRLLNEVIPKFYQGLFQVPYADLRLFQIP